MESLFSLFAVLNTNILLIFFYETVIPIFMVYLVILLLLMILFGSISYFQKGEFLSEDVASDILHYWFGNMLLGFILAFAFYSILSRILPPIKTDLFSEAPFYFQVLIIYLVIELSFYVFHFCLHRFDFLWKFHIKHHLEYQLNWANSFRDSFVTTFVLATFFLFAAELLGISIMARVVALFVHGFLAGVSHYGNNWHFGKFSYFFLSPAVHGYHHELVHRGMKGEQVEVSNYGGGTALFDHLFGTAAWEEKNV